jgi:hypothetical protein
VSMCRLAGSICKSGRQPTAKEVSRGRLERPTCRLTTFQSFTAGAGAAFDQWK